MSKNPFQILDFLGYFFPGATVMIALYCFVPGVKEMIPISTNTSAVSYIVCIILAYIVGHIVSLLSSITVEKYAIWKYGYPSDFLLKDYAPGEYFSRGICLDSRNLSSNEIKRFFYSKIVLRLFIGLLILPVSVLDWILSFLFGVNYYYTRKLSGQQITFIRGKCLLLFDSLGITEHPEKLFDGDYHRIVHNYYYEKAEKHRVRMDNCIAIYGFLRAMSLVMCVVFEVSLIHSIQTINMKMPVDWSQIITLILLALLSYVFYMGFFKFYRKFTIENFMCLLCDTDFDFPKKPESPLIIGNRTQSSYNGESITFN